MLVINPALNEERLNTTVSGITQFIIGLEGIIAETHLLGKRRLAYPIEHQSEGHYVLMLFKARPAVGPQLEARLNILEEIIRYLLVNLD
jgi:small subunit ribosomal protein S6